MLVLAFVSIIIGTCIPVVSRGNCTRFGAVGLVDCVDASLLVVAVPESWVLLCVWTWFGAVGLVDCVDDPLGVVVLAESWAN